jgi:hypothetical protein
MPELLYPQWETESSEDDSYDCQDLDTAPIVTPEVLIARFVRRESSCPI